MSPAEIAAGLTPCAFSQLRIMATDAGGVLLYAEERELISARCVALIGGLGGALPSAVVTGLGRQVAEVGQ